MKKKVQHMTQSLLRNRVDFHRKRDQFVSRGFTSKKEKTTKEKKRSKNGPRLRSHPISTKGGGINIERKRELRLEGGW